MCLTNISNKKTLLEGINFNQIGVSFKGSGSYVPDQILTNKKPLQAAVKSKATALTAPNLD